MTERTNYKINRFALYVTMLSLLTFLVAAGGAALAEVPPGCPENITNYWMLDETDGVTFSDSVGGNGAGCSGSSCPASVPGRIGNAQLFDGIDDGIETAADASLDWAATDSFSIEFWMKTDSASTCANGQVIAGRADSSTQLEWWAGCQDGGQATFFLYDKDGTGIGIAGTTDVADGNWHHIVAVRDQIEAKNLLYVDGVMENAASISYTGGFDSSTAGLDIGWLDLGTEHNNFAGSIDEVALYSAALSSEEIAQHHANGLSGIGSCDLAAPFITSTAATTATADLTYTYDVNATGNPPPTYSLTVYPGGMTIDAATGIIEWTPLVAGLFDVTIQADNGTGTPDTQSFTIQVNQAPVITSTPVTGAVVGQAYTYPVTATGDPSPSYSLTVYPADMTINPTTGLIQWTPLSAGDFPLAVQATNGIDPSAVQTFTLSVADLSTVIPHTGWALKYVDSQETSCENGAAVNAFDNNDFTFWHTQWCTANPAPPHEIQIDLGASYNIDGFRYLPRQDGAINGTIGQYEFYVSSDGVNWGSAVATGTFANTTAQKEVRFSAVTGRYVRLRVLSEVNGNPWTSMAEINVLGTAASGNQAPDGIINAPSQNMTINVGDTVSFTGTGSDPDGDLSLTYLWNFGTNSGIPDSTLQNPGTMTFNNPGTFTVTFTVTDSLGLSDPSPAARMITVTSGNQAPDGIINAPSQNMTINVGDTVSFTGTGSDPDGDLSLTYLWNFGTNSGIPDSTLQNPGTVTFNNAGTFTVTFTVTDSLGLSDPSPAARVIAVVSGDSGESIPDWTSVTYSPFNLGTPAGITNPVLTAADVTDISATYVADPFLFHENNTWYLFFEVYSYDGHYGRIGVAESSDGLHWQYDRIVLDEGIHHSYPLVFKYNNHYYMLPESYHFNEVRLYEAFNFPYDWRYISTLASGRAFVDPSIFMYNNTWWMFVGDATQANCYLFYSDNLLSGWVEHPKSPIVQGDSVIARPGGRSFVFDSGRIIRIAQEDDIAYGWAVRAFQVDVLTKTDYSEHEIPESPILTASGSGWNSTGIHQFDPWWTGTQWIASADGRNLSGEDWSIGIYTSGEASGNQAPDGIINAPSQNMTINVGDTVSFTGTGSDPDGDLSLTYLWNFGTNSGIPDSTLQNPGTMTFNNPGTFTVTFTVTDSLGLSDPSPAARVITVVIPGSTVIPHTGWALKYVDSQETSCENGAAVNAFDNNDFTFWHTQWCTANPAPPHEIQIDLGASYNIDGFRYLPRQDGAINGTIGQYEFYVSSDGVNWGSAVATGTFANTTAQKEVRFSAVTGRYVRLRVLSEVNGNPWTSMAEINVLGTP